MTSILFAGAGAVSVAAAAAIPDSVVCAVASRAPLGDCEVRRVSHFRAAPPQRLTPISYLEAATSSWDVVVLGARPQETEPSVLEFASAAPIVATMSQVPGDLEALASKAAKAVILAPTFLANATSRDPLRVTAWHPRRKLFSAAGDDETVRTVTALMPTITAPTSELSVLASAARTMPFMAELIVQRGNWRRLRRNLQRPAEASSEAVNAVTDAHGSRTSPVLARAALASVSAFAPFDFPTYAAAHFTRHAEQTLAMLETWRTLRPGISTPAINDLHAALTEAIR